jgi:hypothetical protein
MQQGNHFQELCGIVDQELKLPEKMLDKSRLARAKLVGAVEE